jgi:hypothetical protein
MTPRGRTLLISNSVRPFEFPQLLLVIPETKAAEASVLPDQTLDYAFPLRYSGFLKAPSHIG